MIHCPLTNRGAVVGSGASAWPLPAARRRVERCSERGARPPVEPPVAVRRPPERIVVHHTATDDVADGSRQHGSLDALPAGDRMVEGAHAYGRNRTSIGIETEGAYVDGTPPAVQWDALVRLCAVTCRQYGIPPTGIHGHRDSQDGAVCPGDAFHALPPRPRAEVALEVARG